MLIKHLLLHPLILKSFMLICHSVQLVYDNYVHVFASAGLRGRSLPPTPRGQESSPNQRQSPMGQGDLAHDRRSPSPSPETNSPVHHNDFSFQSEVSEMEKATTLLFGDDDQADVYETKFLSVSALTPPAEHDTVPEDRQPRSSAAELPGSKKPNHSKGAKSKSQVTIAANHKIEDDFRLSQLEEFTEYDVGLSQGSALSERTQLKSKLNEEEHQRQMHEETLNQLQVEYNSLLRKYAEAENTIDELRLGAKVTLYTEGAPVPGQAQPGTVTPAQHVQSFNMVQRGSASFVSGTSQAGQMGSITGTCYNYTPP